MEIAFGTKIPPCFQSEFHKIYEKSIKPRRLMDFLSVETRRENFNE